MARVESLLVDNCRETCAKIGKAPLRPFSGNLMLRIAPAVHAQAAVAAEASGTSLNQGGEEVLARAAARVTGTAP